MTRIGEIIETTSTAIIAESAELNQPPALGALCQMQSRDGQAVYGVVSFGRTGGFDPGRRAVRRGSDGADDAEVYRRNPELSRILRTEFSALLVGWRDAAGRIRQRLPAQPPPLHYSVHACGSPDVARFSESLGYLRLLLNSMGELSPDQLIAANVRAVYAARGDDGAWLERASREVASLLKDDHERLMTVLLAIEP
jgi:hypothetical protein